MPEQTWERLDPMVARWKKFTGPDDAERLSAVEHSLTPELQRFVKEFDEAKNDVVGFVAALEKKYGLFETGDIGAETTPEPKDTQRHRALLALRQAYDDTIAELEDRQLTGEA
jgi:hypothetical protein